MKSKDQEIKKLHRLLQDNANSSDLMCKHYCTLLLFTHSVGSCGNERFHLYTIYQVV